MAPKTPKVTDEDSSVGIGFHSGSVCYLNLEDLSFSIFSRMRAFSSALISIIQLIRIIVF